MLYEWRQNLPHDALTLDVTLWSEAQGRMYGKVTSMLDTNIKKEQMLISGTMPRQRLESNNLDDVEVASSETLSSFFVLFVVLAAENRQELGTLCNRATCAAGEGSLTAIPPS